MNRSLAPSIALEQKINYILPETHDVRWIMTLEKISRLEANLIEARKVLALGTDGQFERQLQTKFPNLEIQLS